MSPLPSPDEHDPVTVLAHHVWEMEREMLRRRLQGVGIAVAEWRGDELIQQPIWEVERFRRSARLARAQS